MENKMNKIYIVDVLCKYLYRLTYFFGFLKELFREGKMFLLRKMLQITSSH